MQTLPKPWDLVQTSAKHALDSAKDLWKINLLGAVGSYVLVPLLFAPIGLLFLGSAVGGAPSGGKLAAAIVYLLILAVAGIVLGLWYGNHFLLRVLAIVRKESTCPSPKTSLQRVPGGLWVVILQALATLALPFVVGLIFLGSNLLLILRNIESASVARAATIGTSALGTLAVIAAFCFAIFVSIRLEFSSLLFLDQKKMSVNALKESWRLTQERFWALVWRFVVFLVAYFLTALVVSIVVGIITRILGDNIVSNIVSLVLNAGFTSFLLAPTAMFFTVQLYEAIRRLPASTSTTSA